MTRKRVVVDTNVFVSAMVGPKSTPGQALHKVIHSATLLVNLSMLGELGEVVGHPKFDRYVNITDRKRLLSYLLKQAVIVPTISVITACRDPKDNHVLEAAVNGSADIIITGDKDLLDLNPFHRIKILTPTEYLAR